MAPKRPIRAAASPSPAPRARNATPVSARRTALPTKYSTSYGSSITQLPDRATVVGGGNITQAAAEVFTKVKKDNIAAEARRVVKHQERQSRGSRRSTGSPQPAIIEPTIEVEEPPESDGPSGDEGSEYEYEDEDGSQSGVRRKTAARKRARDDEEAEQPAEQERKERDERLKRERLAEARKLAAQKRVEVQVAAAREKAEAEAAAAKEKAEQERLQRQAARDEAARKEAAKEAMPPPPQPVLPPPATVMTPATASLPKDHSNDRPASARSFIEERNLFLDAKLQTPVKPLPQNVRQSGPTASPQLPTSRPTRNAPFAAPPAEPSPPSTLRKAPARPASLIRLEKEPSEVSDEELPTSEDESTPASAIQEDGSELGDEPEHNQPGKKSWFSFRKLSLLLLKSILALFIVDNLVRYSQHVGLFDPEVMHMPITKVNWHGWRNWTSNVGHLLQPPFLHPFGVLTKDQYDDLKDYLHQRMTTTEAAVENLNSIIPKVVSVTKWRGKIVVSEDFWNALRDRMQNDESILTLDGKARISDKHWKAVEQRLKDSNLLGKPMSLEEVERIIDQTAPSSWEQWLQKNKQKVASLIGTKGGTSKGDSGETVISREEFIKHVSVELAKSRKEIDGEMASLRKHLNTMVTEVRDTLSKFDTLPRSQITRLVERLVSKEIGDRQLRGGSKAQIDAALRRRINYFSLGNNAQIDVTLTSPTWEPVMPRLGSKEFLKSRPPQFLPHAFHALTPWSEPGQCWCAATGGKTKAPPTLSVNLVGLVRPQYFVLEHMDPSATTDPLAMPKHIEIWARFDEPSVHAQHHRRMMDDYPAAAADDTNQYLFNARFVKLDEFAYEHRHLDQGVFVHKLRDVPGDLDVATSGVVIRAVTNYGAEDHTCFYRVRMYGEPAEKVEEEGEKRKGWW